MDSPPRNDPFDDVRDAFSDLGTSEKAAFVFEATFDTIGQALAETGRRVAHAIDDLDIDSWFRAPHPPEDMAPPPPPPPPPARKAPAKKTAGKAKPASSAKRPPKKPPTS